MSLTLAATDTITGVAGSATSITYTIFGDEIAAGADAFKVLAQGQLPSSVGTLYTVPGSTATIVKAIHLVNGTGGAVTARLNVKGTAAANAILPAISILAGGFAVYADDGWKVYNDQGQLLGVGATGATGATGALTVSDEGTPLATDATSLDFVGAGVVASGTGAAKTITIPGGGNVATDAIWDAAGDLAVGTGADAAAKLALTVPAADILEVLGVVNGETTPTWKAVHDGTAPTTQAFGDSAVAGTALTAAHRDHKHGMPASPLGLPLGLTGAVTATRYVGGTASVAPTTGTFAVGDFVITAAGSIYICTVAGTPGTWVAVSGGGGGVAVIPDPGAVWAATTAYVVGNRIKDTGTPVGDSGVAVFECIVAGTSGASNPFGYVRTPVTDDHVTWAFIGAIGQLDDRLIAMPTALSTGANQASANPTAYNSGAGGADAVVQAQADAGTAAAGAAAYGGGGHWAAVIVEADSTGANLMIDDGTGPGAAGQVVTSDGTHAAWAWAAAGGGGSSPCPTLIQIKDAGNTATTITLDIAPVSGHTLILAHDTVSSGLASVSSTNTTWTKMYEYTSSGCTRGIWVGVVSGTGGTTITVTFTGTYNWMTVAEITDTLTGTAGNTGVNGQGVWQPVAAAAGHVVAAMTGNSNTTQSSGLWCSMPAVGFPHAIVPLLITYSGGGQVSTMGDQDHINVEIT